MAASSTAWLLVTTGRPSRSVMTGRTAIAPKFVQEAKIRSMLPSTAKGPSASTAKATISSGPTSAIWKL